MFAAVGEFCAIIPDCQPRQYALWRVLMSLGVFSCAAILGSCVMTYQTEHADPYAARFVKFTPEEQERRLAEYADYMRRNVSDPWAREIWTRMSTAGMKRVWGRYEEARRDFRTIWQDLLKHSTTGGPYPAEWTWLLARAIYEDGYASARLGDRAEITRLTDEVFRIQDPQIQYPVLKDALVFIHLFHSGDLSSYERVIARADELSHAGRVTSGLGRAEDQAWLRGLAAYSKFQQGQVAPMQEAIGDLKWLETNPVIRAGESIAGGLGLFQDLRSVSHALAGYGYAMLGQFNEAKTHFRDALSASEASNDPDSAAHKLRGWIVIAYVDAVLIPLGDPSAERELERGLAAIRSSLSARSERDWAMLAPYQRVAEDLPGTVALKVYAQTGQSGKAEGIARMLFGLGGVEDLAIPAFNKATPQLFVAEAAYQSALAFPHSAALGEVLNRAESLMGDYQGYERWKLSYAKSIYWESGNPQKALAAAEEATRYLDRYTHQRFPDFGMHATFWEDKQVAYDRYVKLLARSASSPNAVGGRLLWAADRANARVMDDRTGATEGVNLGGQGLVTYLKGRLAPGQAIVAWWYDDDLLLRFFLDQRGLEVSGTRDAGSVGRGLEASVQGFRKDTEHSTDTGAANSGSGGKLFDALFGGDVGRLQGLQRLYVVPTKALHAVPWNALPVPAVAQANGYLVDLAEVVVVPALGSSAVPGGSKVERGGYTPVDLIATSEAFGGNELRRAVEEMHCCKVTGGASKGDLLSKLRERGSLVVDSHAAFGIGGGPGQRPLEWGITLRQGSPAETVTLFDVSQIRSGKRFVFLSGCGTGAVAPYSERAVQYGGLAASGESVAGAYRVFFQAGVEDLVLCTSDDTPAWDLSRMIPQVINGLQVGQDPADALRNAILKHKAESPKPGNWGWCHVIKQRI